MHRLNDLVAVSIIRETERKRDEEREIGLNVACLIKERLGERSIERLRGGEVDVDVQGEMMSGGVLVLTKYVYVNIKKVIC